MVWKGRIETAGGEGNRMTDRGMTLDEIAEAVEQYRDSVTTLQDRKERYEDRDIDEGKVRDALEQAQNSLEEADDAIMGLLDAWAANEVEGEDADADTSSRQERIDEIDTMFMETRERHDELQDSLKMTGKDAST
jgi:chromosome segregation ATPase